jgi:hypothetical protein
MIIVQLKGGLGNQLFQYAAGFSLARHHNVLVKVDIRELEQADKAIGTTRNFELQNLTDPPAVATNQQIESVKPQSGISKYFEKLLPPYQRQVYREKSFQFDEHFFESGKNVYLKGYRQSEKYFSVYAEQIRKSFQLKPNVVTSVIPYAEKLASIESVSIHIRRGDYTSTNVESYHGMLAENYYQEAIDHLCESLSNPYFFVFSDNIEWVKRNLKFESQVEFMSGAISTTHYEDFYLMSKCKHNIIANSSFSWWSAWLNSNPNKIVVAPKNWFATKNIDTKDLIPESWIRL